MSSPLGLLATSRRKQMVESLIKKTSMETKMKKIVKAQHMAGIDVCSIILLVIATSSQFLWMYGMTLESAWLIRITLWTMILSYSFAIVRLIYTFWRAWRRCEPTVDRPEGEIVLSDTLNSLCSALIVTFMTVVLGNVLLYCILPEQWILLGASVLFLGGVAFELGAAAWYLTRYYREQRGQVVAHAGSADTFFLAATRYLDHIMVSDNVQVAFCIALAMSLLDMNVTVFLSDGQYQIFQVLMQVSWFLFSVMVFFEFMRLHRHHERVVNSHPHHSHQQSVLSQLALLSIFAVPIAKHYIYAQLPMHTADIVSLVLSVMIALALVFTSLYFRIFRSKYIKASTLAW